MKYFVRMKTQIKNESSNNNSSSSSSRSIAAARTWQMCIFAVAEIDGKNTGRSYSDLLVLQKHTRTHRRTHTHTHARVLTKIDEFIFSVWRFSEFERDSFQNV